MTAIRTSLGAALLVFATACSGGVNAGKQGGVAFIGLTIMLLLGAAIMWFAMGRDE